MYSNSLHNNFLLSLKACIIMTSSYSATFIYCCTMFLSLFLYCVMYRYISAHLKLFEVKKAKNMPHNHTYNYYISPTQPMDMDVCFESIIAYAYIIKRSMHEKAEVAYSTLY